jgi:hypothetical protein
MRTFLLLFFFCAAAAVAQETRLASYYLNDPVKWEGKKITVNCSHVQRANGAERPDGLVTFYAYTASRSEWRTAYITVLVAPGDASKFAKKYGYDYEYDQNYSYRTRPLSGMFLKGPGEYYIEYKPST